LRIFNSGGVRLQLTTEKAAQKAPYTQRYYAFLVEL
jgi:hypothetical protein